MFIRREMQPSSRYPDQTQPLLDRFAGRSSTDGVRSPEGQHDLDPAWLRRFSFNQTCAALRKSTAQHMRDVNQGTAPANHTSVMRAVTDNVALGTQDSILQSDRIQHSATWGLIFT